MENISIFFSILNNFLHPDKECDDLSKITQEEWISMFRLAKEQAVFPIVFDKAWNQEGYAGMADDMKNAYRLKSRNDVIAQSLKTEYFLSIYKQFTDEGIHPLVVKGIILRNIYQKPDYRMSSDEDMLVNKNDFSKVDNILLSNGYNRQQIENPLDEHEISYYNPSRGSAIELHLTLFPETSDAYGHLNHEFENVFERAIYEEINGTKVYTLFHTQHMFYLVCHSLKHFMHSGFGVRQLMDIINFAEVYGNTIDWDDIIRRAKHENMYVFLMNLFAGGEKYLGFSWEKANLKKPQIKLNPKNLIIDMIDGGVFGQNDEARLHSSNITLQAVNANKAKAVSKSALFPNFNYMKNRYPYLKKYKWMLPFAWIQRIFSYGKRMRKTGIEKTIEVGNKRVDLLKQYDIIE